MEHIMSNWFTVEEIDSGTYAISEYRHWEETHCYLLCGTDCALLIGTGLGISNIKAIVDKLTSLPIMVATTHVHWDHIGGHKYFENIAVHETEKDWLSVEFPIPLSVVKSNLTLQPCDLVYKGCLDAFYPTTDPLQFWHSIQKIQHLPVARILPGHHQLFGSVDMIGKIEKAFDTLQMAGQLYQGAGVFNFTDFQIHI